MNPLEERRRQDLAKITRLSERSRGRIAITDATLFIGSGARLNIDSTKPEFGTVSLPASNDPTAIGFSVAGGNLDLGVFTASAVAANGTSYLVQPLSAQCSLLTGVVLVSINATFSNRCCPMIFAIGWLIYMPMSMIEGFAPRGS